MRANYDQYEDVLYLTLTPEPVEADDSHTSNGIIVRTQRGVPVGFTIIDASEHLKLTKKQLSSVGGKGI